MSRRFRSRSVGTASLLARRLSTPSHCTTEALHHLPRVIRRSIDGAIPSATFSCVPLLQREDLVARASEPSLHHRIALPKPPITYLVPFGAVLMELSHLRRFPLFCSCSAKTLSRMPRHQVYIIALHHQSFPPLTSLHSVQYWRSYPSCSAYLVPPRGSAPVTSSIHSIRHLPHLRHLFSSCI